MKRLKTEYTTRKMTILAERVQYYGKDGKLITESLKDYTQKALRQEYTSLDDFLNQWSLAEQKQAIITELQEQGIIFAALEQELGQDLDPFDLICHLAFDQPPLSRQERANNVRNLTNPPFGGKEEDGIETNFPSAYRTKETADLFLVLIMHLLADGGRGGIVLPDGTLFGEGVKTRIKEKLLDECNLHTIVRLPNGCDSFLQNPL